MNRGITRDVSRMHVDFQRRLNSLLLRLVRANIPLQPYETWRSPFRQEGEYAFGRTRVGPRPSAERPMGGCVTWAQPWRSLHQYGMAADLVFWVRQPEGKDAGWSWDEPRKGMWATMHTLAREEGLTPLYNRKGELIELAHVQLPNVTAEDLLAGRYPAGGGSVWEDELARYIHEWEAAGRTGAPPVIVNRPEVLAEAS